MKSSVTSAVLEGKKGTQEDRHFYKRIGGPKFHGWLLAVMDGHGGSAVSELCVKEIGEAFKLSDPADTEDALKDLVLRLDLKTSDFYEMGTTLSVACILESHNKVSVAILGDSPVIVLDKKNKLHVSPEHNVRSNPDELEAAKKRGGVVLYDYLYVRGGDYDYGLQMSRGLGDSALQNVLSREPEIYTIKDPVWVLVASDGLIDPGHRANSKKLHEQIENYAKRRDDGTNLIQWAETRFPRDNVTAVVWSRALRSHR